MLDLIKVFHTAKSQELIAELRGISVNLGDVAERIALNAVSDVTQLGYRAEISKVPVDTKELRNQHFHVSISHSDLTGFVTVDDAIHIGRGKPKPASELVDILEGRIKEGGPNRTQDSIPADAFGGIAFGKEDKGTPKDFEQKAEDALLPAVDRFVRIRNFNY